MQFSSLSFLLGVLISQQFSQLPAIAWGWLLVALVPGFLLTTRLTKKLRPVVAGLCGFLWAVVVANTALESQLDPKLEGKDLLVVGQVVSIPKVQERHTRFEFIIEDIVDSQYKPLNDESFKVQLNWYKLPPQIYVGDRWQLLIRLKRPHGFMNPGGFDYERWLFQKGIVATGYVKQSKKQDTPIGHKRVNHKILSNEHSDLWLDSQRELLSNRIGQSLLLENGDSNELTKDSSNEFSGMIKALTMGDRNSISSQQWDVLLKTGTNHLMAISGLHIGLIAGLIFFLTRKLWSLFRVTVLRYPAQKAAALAAITAALLYAALAGFSIPTQRALVMVVVFMLSIIWQRNVRPSQVLSLALMMVLILDPFAVMEAGFWLSFTAVAVILYGMVGRKQGDDSDPQSTLQSTSSSTSLSIGKKLWW